MTRAQKTFAVLLALLFFLPLKSVLAESIQGRVVEMDHLRKTFRVEVGDPSERTTISDIVVVRPDTQMEGFNWIWELQEGDRVGVRMKRLNPIVWKALNLKRV